MTTAAASDCVRTELFICGEQETAGRYLSVTDPARPHVVVGEQAAASEGQALAAVAAADAAFPAWSALSASERADVMLSAATTIEGPQTELARLLTLENGKTLPESLGDVAALGALFRQVAGLAEEVEEPVRYVAPPYDTEVGRIPLGVVTIILPFNWPLAILGASLPNALLAGNTVVVKPPLTAPLATVMAVERLAAALPPGVVNIITGEDAVVGAALVQNRSVAKVCFTGSGTGGRRIMEMAAQTLTRVTLELGGNDPVILLDDAMLDEVTLDRLYDAVYASTGQICMAAKRIYVHRSRYADVVEGLAARLEECRLGHGLDSATTMGPLHQRQQLDYVYELVDSARSSGAEVQEFAEVPNESSLKDGYFTRPSLVLDPPSDAAIVTEEQFGPSVPVIPFDREEDALAAANDGWSGLCASVWSEDEVRAKRLASQLRAGYCWVNAHGAGFVDHRAPFGGFRASGMGREFGIEGVRDFMEFRSLSTLARVEATDPAVTGRIVDVDTR